VKSENLKIEFEELNYNRIDDIFEYSGDKEFFKYLTSQPHKTKKDTKEFIDYLFQRVSNNDTKYWFIKIKDIDKVIGTIGLLNIADNSAELAYGMSLKYAGLGYINEVLLLICEYVFNDLNLNTLHGGTNIKNNLVINTLKSLSFQEDKQKTNKTHWYYSMDKEYYLNINSKLLNNSNTKMTNIVSVVSNILDEKIDEDSSMDNCFNWDSLTHINIIEEISNQYNIKFKPKDVVKATSIKQIYNIVNNYE